MADYTYRLNISPTTIPPIDTSTCFDIGHVETEKSPIDSFFEKMTKLNEIHVRFSKIEGIGQESIDAQNNLVLLGYISAVESYFREILRKLIIIDKASRVSSEEQQLNYGAAINYPTHLLPEALLERSSYASKKNIVDAFKTFLGISGHIPNELETTLLEFEKICHLRHCVVHRFGKLGSNNAIKFGLDNHTNCLEKPLSLDTLKLYAIYQVCENTVLVINQFLYSKIMTRTVKEVAFSIWKWDLRKDKKNFQLYYNLFASTLRNNPTSNLQTAYNELKKHRTT